MTTFIGVTCSARRECLSLFVFNKAMSASPGDEFDDLPDAIDFGAISEADWLAMQNTPASNNMNESSQDSVRSSQEFELDYDFMAHVDEIERQDSNRLPLTESAGVSSARPCSSLLLDARSNTCSSSPRLTVLLICASLLSKQKRKRKQDPDYSLHRSR